jgi:hypothetical protein
MSAQGQNLGTKYKCFKCGCKFYDLGAPEPLCPRCGADQREDPNPDPRAAFLARLRRPQPVAVPPEAPEPEEEPIDELDADDDLLDEDFAEGLEGLEDEHEEADEEPEEEPEEPEEE